ncbi:zinc finger and BTB domain-containing protein 24-like [Notolabrus celidotus]|uniref:zinc finger and BTB domain-containing protein 24-like n=1 Tax=Notolabrus celidotus TaxID=1203425 RepID=UPI0014900853|nr:zinc finger and BTB domain-containing protein 24-like [Notolabrus celidotus]
MSSRSLLRTFVNERLTAAAEEIFQVFEGAIAKYEEEASSSKQEIERLRGLLLEIMPNENQDPCRFSICKEETSPKQHPEQEPNLSVCQKNSEPLHIKEEDHELWADEQQEENQLSLPYSSTWETNEEEDTKPPMQPRTQHSKSEQFQEPQGTKTIQFMLPLPSYQALTQNERVQDGREEERPFGSLILNQTQTNPSQSSASQGSTQNSAANNSRCCLCDKSFTSYKDLISHACPMNSKEADFPCALCGETFESTESLNVHLKSHKGLKCCHVCGKSCNSVTALTEHMASHAGSKLHRCHVCGKKCSRKGDLKIHMRIHTGEKPFYCSLCCKSFTHSGHLRKHMRSHTGERPHQCEVCGRGFLQSVHLKSHLETHARKC